MDCSTPDFPVHPQLPEFTQTHVLHWVHDAIQPSRPLSSPFPPAFHLAQHQGLFQWVSSLHQMAKVLEFQLQHQSFQWIFRTDLTRTQKTNLSNRGNGTSILEVFSWIKITGVFPLPAVWEQRNKSIQEYPSFTWFPVYYLTIICRNRHNKHLVCLLDFCLSPASKHNIEG